MALTLVTAAAAPLVTLAEVKRHCRVDHTDDDTYLEALVAAITANIDGADGWLGRCLGEQTWKLSLPYFPCGRIYLPLPPLQGVTEVAYTDVDGAPQTYADFREFGVDSRIGQGFILPAYDGEWPETRDDTPEAVQITFTAGYAALPTPIKHAILLMVGSLYEHREDASHTKMEQMPFASTALLTPYRSWAISSQG